MGVGVAGSECVFISIKKGYFLLCSRFVIVLIVAATDPTKKLLKRKVKEEKKSHFSEIQFLFVCLFIFLFFVLFFTYLTPSRLLPTPKRRRSFHFYNIMSCFVYFLFFLSFWFFVIC